MKAAVRLEDVTFTYPGSPRPALAGVSLEARRGEVTAVAGPAGSGTSTLLLVAAGFAPRLTGGTLTGSRVFRVARPCIVFASPWTQLTGLCYTVRHEVAFGPAAHGLPRGAVLSAADAAMGALAISHLAERDPTTLSGGELQRVVLASAVALAPDLLALDDPAAELDPEGADALYALLARLARRGTAVLVATTDLGRAARIATRAFALDGGRVVAEGPARQTLVETDVAAIALAAGCPAPLPIESDDLVARVIR